VAQAMLAASSFALDIRLIFAYNPGVIAEAQYSQSNDPGVKDGDRPRVQESQRDPNATLGSSHLDPTRKLGLDGILACKSFR
jgi:hypothetical protein